jgi:hypothetical protein
MNSSRGKGTVLERSDMKTWNIDLLGLDLQDFLSRC